MKSMRDINLDTYSLSLLTAKEDILNPRTSTNWALFAYDGIMNRLKLADSGVGGLRELMTKLHPRRPLYGMCRAGTNQSHIIMILWVGNEVDEYRRAECASHLPVIRSFFREVQIFLPAHTLDEITEERICSLASKAVMVMQGPRQSPRREDRQDAVGTNYKRTIAAAEILRIQRDSFWAQAEREENKRKKDEQQRAAEDRRQREMERFHQERREAVERERKMMEREQKIKEQRRIQVQMEAEERRQERIKWKHQEKERKEDETRARYTRSESEEKAAEAAALVSQRTVNPREFFRQLSSSSLNSVSQPTSPNPGKSSYRQQHLSQTDNIFIFNEPSSFTPPSPYRSRAVSPYLPSPPTPQSPTLVFPNSLTSFLHSPAMTSPTISKQNVLQDALISSRSPIQTSYEVTARPTSQIENQLFPLVNMNESEIKSPITAIIDSLVFYPLPLNREELQSDNQVKTTDELPPPPPDFELSPKPSEELPEDSMQTQPDISLFSQSTSDSPVCTSDALTSSPPPPSSPVSLIPSCLPVPQPPSRPLPALPVTPQTLNEMESERDFTARVSVISTVEEELEEETEREDKERDEKIHEEHEIRDEENDMGEEKDEVTRCEEEEKGDGGERVKMEEKRKENIGQEETDGSIMEKHIVEESESEFIEEVEKIKESETEKIKHGEIMTECENVIDKKNMEESESEKDQEDKIMEESESEKYQEEKIMEESESEKYKEEKIMEESECEIYQDETIMQKSGSKKCQDENDSESQKSEEQKDKQRESEDDEKSIKNRDSEKDRKDKGDYQEKYKQALMNQESEETSSVDINMTINPTVFKAESDTENIMTDEEGVKKMISDKQNEKEERNTEFMKTEETAQAEFVEDDDPLNADKHDVHEPCSETLFSQHAPVFPESSASTPDQYSHKSTPEDISDYNENETKQNKTSAISESQSDGEEEPEAVKQFIKGQDVAVDLDVSNDPTNEKPDAEEGEKASLIASTNNTFEARQDSNRQHLNEAKQHEFSQNCGTPDDISDCKKSDVSCTVGGEITDNC